MRYKRILEEVEAFYFKNDYQELAKWYLKHAKTAKLPFMVSGQYIIYTPEPTGLKQPQVIEENSYIILGPDKKSLKLMKREDFLNQYRALEETGKKQKKGGKRK